MRELVLSSQVASSFFSLMRGFSCPSGVGDAEERERENGCGSQWMLMVLVVLPSFTFQLGLTDYP